MTAATLTTALGGSGQSRSGWYSFNCPVCQGEGKLGLEEADGGLVVHCFKLCRRIEILAKLDHLGLLRGERGEPEDAHQAAQRRPKEGAETRLRIAEARDFVAKELLAWIPMTAADVSAALGPALELATAGLSYLSAVTGA
jgi:hypothetical protein